MASFGVRLKQEREQRGITLEEISATTKIGTRMLVALEQDHFDQLPGGIFNKGFIRAYARCLGLDEDQTIADYLVATGTPPADKEKDKDRDRDKRSDSLTESSFDLHAESERRDSNLPWGTFAILLLLIALGFAGWGFYSREARKNVRKIPSPVAASKNPAASTNLVSTTPVSNQPVSAQPVSAINNTEPNLATARSPETAVATHHLTFRFLALRHFGWTRNTARQFHRSHRKNHPCHKRNHCESWRRRRARL